MARQVKFKDKPLNLAGPEVKAGDKAPDFACAVGLDVVNLAGTYDLGNGFTAFARIDDLLDKRYQDPTGFLRPGLSAFGGIKMAFHNEASAADHRRSVAYADTAATRDRPGWTAR